MELTDEQLEKRASDLAIDEYPVPIDPPDMRGKIELRKALSTLHLQRAFRSATLDRLKDARESLRLLERAPHTFTCESEFEKTMEDSETPDDLNPCICGLIPHIAHLKALLGITDTNN
jgi:hypothetical protein